MTANMLLGAFSQCCESRMIYSDSAPFILSKVGNGKQIVNDTVLTLAQLW